MKQGKAMIGPKKLALFMIVLVVSLIINTSVALAGLTKIEAYGADNVLDVIRETDSIKFKATATIPGDTDITPNQLILGGMEQFSSCIKVIDSFVCETKYPTTGTAFFDPRAIPYTITLKNDANNIVEEKTGSMIVDKLPPLIESISVDQSSVSLGIVKVSYVVKDTACSATSCFNKCAGVSKIELVELNRSFTQTIPVSNASCTASGSYEIPASRFTDGVHVLVAKAYDRLNQPSAENALTFILDKSAPVIDQSTLKITDETGFDLQYVGPRAVSATVTITIRDSTLDLDSVRADLSEFGGQESAFGTCDQAVPLAGENAILAVCKWPLTLKARDSGTKKIIISARDATGNRAEATIIKEMLLDEEAPTVTSLASASVLDGTNFAKMNGNVITARFSDKSGMKPSTAILKADSRVYTANACVPEAGLWKCVWNSVSFSGAGTKVMSVEDSTKDRVGNELVARYSKDVIVDQDTPVLRNITIKGVSPNIQIDNVTKTGDSIFVEAYLTDDYIQSATADLSRYIIGATNVAGQCTKIGTRNFKCIWNTAAINVNGHISSSIHFTFTDAAGNEKKHSAPFTVYGVDSGTAEFWDSTVQCSPSVMDRETFDLINQRTFCHVHLRPSSSLSSISFGSLKPVSIKLGPCQGDVGWIEAARLHNNQAGSLDPYIELIFKKQNANANEVNIVCPLAIVTSKDNKIMANAEAEQIPMHFEFYNMPLGEVSASVQEKIDTAVEDATGLWSWLGTIKKIMFYMTQICNFLALFKTIIQAFNIIKGLFIGNSLLTFQTYMCNNVESLKDQDTWNMKAFNRFCGYVNCKFSPGESPTDFEKNWLGWMDDWRQGGYGMINALGFDIEKWTGKPLQEYMNPKGSIVVSILTGCIPGIIYGLDKYRQIQCMYADCLMTGVGEQGLPVYVCDDQKNYATCKYVVGEVFNVVPFTALFNYYMARIKKIVSDPFEILGVALVFGCRQMCSSPPTSGAVHTFCLAPKIAQLLTSSIQDVAGLLDGSPFTMPDDYCTVLEKKIEEKGNTTTTK